MKELLITLLYVSCDIPRYEFGKEQSVYIFPVEKTFVIAPTGQLTYSINQNYIELPDNTEDKDAFMVGLLYVYWNADQLEQIAKQFIPRII